MTGQTYGLNTLFDSIEENKKTISSELHDNICTQLHILKWSLSSSNEIKINDIQFLDSIIKCVRELSHNLYSPILEYGGILEAIRAFLYPLSNKFNIEIQVLRIEIESISNKIKLHVFRIFQEIICNIIKHASATKILIQLKITPKSLFIKIIDNGIGFKMNQKYHGIGLGTIHHRAKLINAVIKYKYNGNCFLLKAPLNI